MNEYIERAVVQCEPADDLRKVRGWKRNLIAPHRMRPDRLLVKAPHLDGAGELGDDHLAQRPSRVAAARVEVHVRMPAFDQGGSERSRHEMECSRARIVRGLRV